MKRNKKASVQLKSSGDFCCFFDWLKTKDTQKPLNQMMGATVVAFLVHKREQLREDMDLNYGREQWNQGVPGLRPIVFCKPTNKVI